MNVCFLEVDRIHGWTRLCARRRDGTIAMDVRLTREASPAEENTLIRNLLEFFELDVDKVRAHGSLLLDQ